MEYRYCPTCGAEYRPGFTRCSECDVELVDELPSTRDDGKEYFSVLDPLHPDYVYDAADWEHGLEPVRLTSVGSELEAEMVVGMLTANEVRAYYKNESSHPISHYGGQAARSSPLSLYRIYVHPDDEDQARAMIGEVEETTAPQPPLLDDAAELASPRKGWTTGVALFVLLFGFLPGGIALYWLVERIFD
jgi:hypothetical protein